MSIHRRAMPRILTACTVLIVTLIQSPAGAQGGSRPVEDAVRPDYTERDVTIMTAMLELRPEQHDACIGLVRAYLTAIRNGSKELQRDVAAAQVRVTPTAGEREVTDRMFRQRVRELVAELKQREAALGDKADLVAMRKEYRERLAALRREMGLDVGGSGGAETVEQRLERHHLTEAAIEGWTARKRSLTESLVRSIQSSLDAQQLERWPLLARRLVRDKELRSGRISGESTNLFTLIERAYVPVESEDAVTTLLEDYDLELHRALVSRRAILQSTQSALTEALILDDLDEAERLLDRQAAPRVVIRDLNDRFAAALVESLGTGGPSFRSRYDQAAYQRAYQETAADRAFRRAAAFTLDEGTALELDELKQSYDNERQRLNQWLVDLLRREEPREAARRLIDRRSRLNGEAPGPDPIREALAERRILSQQYLKHLEALLGADRIGSRSGFDAGTPSTGAR